ncbi:MAG: stage II sporulation protein M [Nanoarchaeota archaeon]|nr:stage II sporulation protein M [Nanoarchaeota archaeon]MBU1631795.1 stage II sporulation protein M [Nanoarchaeota archaeon]MBU1876587.1 stage II sporulation protein M [Nanoarchaeota archaeon]
MVLESIFNPFVVKKKPWEMFFAGFLYSIVGMLLAYLVFKEATGLLMVFFIVISALPLVYTAIKNEEELDIKSNKEWLLLKEHSKVLTFLLFLFLGVTLALVLAYVFLPQETAHTVFNLQEKAIKGVNSNVQGDVVKGDILTRIFINNLKVLFFCLLFSFLYGTGAIFILTWNASVVAVAIGNLIKLELSKTATLVGFNTLSSYFGVTTFGFFRYMTHGILEMAAYFLAGIAGSIISIAMIKHNLDNDNIMTDTLDLIVISLGILFVAGIVEVYITPIFFA